MFAVVVTIIVIIILIIYKIIILFLILLNYYYLVGCSLLHSSSWVRVKIRFSVWLVSCYAHVFVGL